MRIIVNIAEQLLRWYGTAAVCAMVFRWYYGMEWSIAAGMALLILATIGPILFAVLDGLHAWITGDDE